MQIEYNIQTSYDSKTIDKILDYILYYQSIMEINDIDISTGNYIKIRSDGQLIDSLNYEPDYIKKLYPKYIKHKKGTEEYKKEYEEMLKEIKKLKGIYNNVLCTKIDKNLIDGLIKYTLTEKQKEELYNNYGIDYSIGKDYSNYRINLSFQDLDNGELGLYFSIRKINKTPFTLEQMGVNETIYSKFQLGSGLILISGPTGSAKTSTLISILNEFNNTISRKIITIEDPIEFFWSDLQNKCTFRQREIGRSCKDFPEGLRQAVRQDPDIIIIGEIRDAETAMLAIEAANTGHLVIATIHVNSATDSLGRLLGFFDGMKAKEAAVKLSDVLKLVLNQRLVFGVDGGKYAVYEYLDTTVGGIKSLIKENDLNDMRKKMYEVDLKNKMPHKTLNESLFELVVRGVVSKERAKNVYSNEKNIFDSEFEIFLDRYLTQSKEKKDEVLKRMYITTKLEEKKNLI